MADCVRIQLRPQDIRAGQETEVLLRDDRSIEWRITELQESNIEAVWFDKAAETWEKNQRWLTMQMRKNCDLAPWDIPEIPQWIPFGLRMSAFKDADNTAR